MDCTTGKPIALLRTSLIVFSIAIILFCGTVTLVLAAADTINVNAPGNVNAVISYGTDKDVYTRGDRVNGYVEIKNTGDKVINTGTVSVSVSRNVPVLGALKLASRDITLENLNIKPGETLRKEFSETIPAEFAGLSTAGKYRVSATVTLEGTNVGTFTKDVEIK